MRGDRVIFEDRVTGGQRGQGSFLRQSNRRTGVIEGVVLKTE